MFAYKESQAFNVSIILCKFKVFCLFFIYGAILTKSKLTTRQGILQSSTLRILRSTDSDYLIITYPLSKIDIATLNHP